MTITIVRNHLIDYFLQCPFKYKIKAQGWQERDKPDKLTIGTAVHAGLATWSLTIDEAKACADAFALLGEDDDLTDLVFLLLNGYFRKYRDDRLTMVCAETEFSVPLLTQVQHGVEVSCALRIDGLVQYDEKYWILERKTTAMAPGNFWHLYRLNRQATGYLWASRIKFELPIAGVCIDAVFKPNYKTPEPKYERRFLTNCDTEAWYKDTVQIVGAMLEAERKDEFYKTWACFSRYNSACELLEYCAGGELIEILNSTHVEEAKT